MDAEAQPHSAHLHWGADTLWETLVPLLPGVAVEVLARVESTNTRLLERARAVGGDPDNPVTRPGDLDPLQAPVRTPHGRRAVDLLPCLLVAEQQTRGRGRLGRGWVSNVGASLTFSLSLPLAPQQWGGLSLAAGLALAQALDPLTPGQAPRIGLKWPNDLWLLDGSPAAGSPPDSPRTGRKLGGILIETITVGAARLCVVGVGLNVQPQPAAETATLSALTHGYACLQELQPDATAPQVLHRVAKPLVQALKRFEAEGFAPLRTAYAQRDLLAGRAVSLSAPEGAQGVAEGVDEHGALLVRMADAGEPRAVASGEVSVRLVNA
jgi:BirA family transcriptional regulator, biotin operon repressor / biotin---[acetyl-CoA-carboxylase] ligase